MRRLLRDAFGEARGPPGSMPGRPAAAEPYIEMPPPGPISR